MGAGFFGSRAGGKYEREAVLRREGRAAGSFYPLWLAQGSDNLAYGFFVIAAPLVAASITRSPLLVSGVSVALGLPWLLVALPAGAIVDRSDRRRVAIRVAVVRGLVLGILAALIATGWLSLWLLYVLVFVLACAHTFGDVALDALIPQVVRDEALHDANRKIKITSTLNSDFIGSAGGGALAGASLALPFTAGCALFALAGASVASLKGDYRVQPRNDESIRASVWEGLAFLWSHPLLRPLALMLAAVVTGISMHLAVLVLFATDAAFLGLGEFGYGALFAANAAGAVATGLALRRVVGALGEARLIQLAVVGGIVYLATPGLVTEVAVVAAAMVAGGAAEMAYSVTVQTIVQRVTPAGLLGRLSSAYSLIAWGPIAVGAGLGGIIGNVLGLQAVFLVAASIVVVAAMLLLRHLKQEHVNQAFEQAANREEE